MTERSTPLSLLIAFVAVLSIALSAGIAADRAEARPIESPPCFGACEESPCISACEPPVEVERPDPKYSLLVLNVGWDTGNPATSSPLVEANLPLYAGEIKGRVNNWLRETSRGLFPGWQVAPGGSYTIAPPSVPAFGCISGPSGDAVVREIWAHAEAAARSHGIEPNEYRVVTVVWDRHVCQFRGVGDEIGGRRVALQSPTAATHELGHILGLDHANSISCTGPGGQLVPLSANCGVSDYGDVYDTMGLIGNGLFNAIYENALGWMNGQIVNLAAGDYSQTMTLKPLSEIAQSPRAVRLVDGSTTLWIEYRQPTGLDLPSEPTGEGFGVLVHRQVGPTHTGSTTTSQLLDMSPEGSSLDSALPVGQTWADPLGEMKITVNGANAKGAMVTIAKQGAIVPNLGGDTLELAEAALKAAGLTYGGASFVTDESCTLINKVMSQTPPEGTRVPPGTSVRVSIGVKDTEHECP